MLIIWLWQLLLPTDAEDSIAQLAGGIFAFEGLCSGDLPSSLSFQLHPNWFEAICHPEGFRLLRHSQ